MEDDIRFQFLADRVARLEKRVLELETKLLDQLGQPKSINPIRGEINSLQDSEL